MVETLHRQKHATEKKDQKLFERDFLKLMNNFVFEKTMENMR